MEMQEKLSDGEGDPVILEHPALYDLYALYLSEELRWHAEMEKKKKKSLKQLRLMTRIQFWAMMESLPLEAQHDYYRKWTIGTMQWLMEKAEDDEPPPDSRREKIFKQRRYKAS